MGNGILKEKNCAWAKKNRSREKTWEKVEKNFTTRFPLWRKNHVLKFSDVIEFHFEYCIILESCLYVKRIIINLKPLLFYNFFPRSSIIKRVIVLFFDDYRINVLISRIFGRGYDNNFLLKISGGALLEKQWCHHYTNELMLTLYNKNLWINGFQKQHT